MADLNVLFQSLFSFKTFLTKFSKETLAVTLLFQCNFLLVVGADNLIWQFYFYFYRILSIWCWINTKVFIGFSIPSACTQTFPGIRWVNFIEDYIFFGIEINHQNTYTQKIIWYNTNYVRKNNVFSYHIVVSAVYISKSLIWW